MQTLEICSGLSSLSSQLLWLNYVYQITARYGQLRLLRLLRRAPTPANADTLQFQSINITRYSCIKIIYKNTYFSLNELIICSKVYEFGTIYSSIQYPFMPIQSAFQIVINMKIVNVFVLAINNNNYNLLTTSQNSQLRLRLLTLFQRFNFHHLIIKISI